MTKPIIINWLLTRKCNLRCKFCGIVREPRHGTYSIKDKYKNELPIEKTKLIADYFSQIKPKPFVILYGGEPTLYPGIKELVQHLNDLDFPYTLISNGVGTKVQSTIIDLVKNYNLKGFSMSLDPLVYDPTLKTRDPDRYKKSKSAYKFLKQIKELKPDIDAVAEITVDNENVFYLEKLLKELTDNNIYASITTIETSKNIWYDFATSYCDDLLIKPGLQSYNEFKRIIDKILLNPNLYKVHYPEILKILVNSLPMNYHCNFKPHNLTIDADGEIRLCLRIHGENNLNIMNYLNQPMKKFLVDTERWFNSQKNKCEGCAWTCMIMTQLANSNPNFYRQIVHNQVS